MPQPKESFAGRENRQAPVQAAPKYEEDEGCGKRGDGQGPRESLAAGPEPRFKEHLAMTKSAPVQKLALAAPQTIPLDTLTLQRISAPSSIIPAVKGHDTCPRPFSQPAKVFTYIKFAFLPNEPNFRPQTVASGTELRPALGRPGGRAENCDGWHSEIFRAPIPRQAEDAKVQGRCASEPEA